MAPHHRRLLLLISTTAAAMTMLASTVVVVALPPQPSSSCRRKCGDVDIPFPFGITSGSSDSCSLPGFNLTCAHVGGGVYKPFYLKVEVLAISLQTGQARMLNHISSSCYNTATRKMDNTSWILNFIGTPYRCSDAVNKFTVIGRHALAYIEDNINNRYTSGCVAMFRGGGGGGGGNGGTGNATTSATSQLTNGSCSGIGCCQTAIPKGLQYYSVRFDDKFNTSDIYTVSRCNFAVLMDSSDFTFLASYASSLDFNKTYDGRAPIVVDWAIGEKASGCEAASKDPDTYACVSNNSECFDSPSGKGYICKCSKGFDGNPYLQDPKLGCKDINECENPSKYPCNFGTCHNTLGGFECVCPPGTRGNANIEPCVKQRTKIIGILIGLCLGIGTILVSIIGLFLVRRWRRHLKKQMRKKHFQKNQGLLLEQLIASDQNAHDNTKIFSYEELQKATNDFDPARMLGSGGHGTVYKGILSNQRVVAIKRSKVIEEGEINQFINEVAILSQINHRNIVKLFGCCLETEVPLLVYDFVPNGSLFEIIHDDGPGRDCALSWEDCLRIATEAAGALHYLHSAASISVFHRDVKSSNILLDANYVAKIADFGASRSIPINQTHITTNVQGTYGYLDPEYYHTGQLNEKSDVYSFGVVLLELLLRKKPVFMCESGLKKNLSNYFLEEVGRNKITNIVSAQVLEEATESEIDSIAVLAESCLRIRGEERPTMKQVEMTLQSLRRTKPRSRPVPPIKDEEIQPLIYGRPVNNNMQAPPINTSTSSACYSLEREFLWSANLPR